MVDVVESLRENSPNQRYSSFSLEDESLSDHELSQALQANQHVTHLIIYTNGTRECSWVALLRVIATREILSTVGMSDYDDTNDEPQDDLSDFEDVYDDEDPQGDYEDVYDDEDPQVIMMRNIKFLQAIQMNAAIQTVNLMNIQVPGASIASFLDSATSVTTLLLENVNMEVNGQVRGAQELAAALQRNTNIRRLDLCKLNDVYMVPILSGLATNNHVNTLILDFGVDGLSLVASAGLESLMESNATIDKFTLALCRFQAQSFRPIAQGLINSESITHVRFVICSFEDEGSALLLKSVLHTKSKGRSLAICDCTVHGGTLPSTFFDDVLRPDSPLRSLEFSSSMLTDDGYTAFLSLVEKSKLEQLDLGVIRGRQKYLALIASIPKMQLRKLKFKTRWDEVMVVSSVVAQAVKKNSSLRIVVSGVRTFSNNDRRKVDSYTARNEGLSHWIAAPSTIPRSAWPQAIEAARAIGPDAVVRILHVLGGLVGPVEGKRACKRPRFFSPTW
jgi:hypothetical protein